MISQGTHGLNLYVKISTLLLPFKVCVTIYDVRREKKFVRLLVFAVIMEENFKSQAS